MNERQQQMVRRWTGGAGAERQLGELRHLIDVQIGLAFSWFQPVGTGTVCVMSAPGAHKIKLHERAR